jgi:hypothetical protein
MKSIIFFILGLISGGLLIGIPLQIDRDMERPASWYQVRLGDSYDDLKNRFPNLYTGMHNVKNLDQLEEHRLTGMWWTGYQFDQNERLILKSTYFSFNCNNSPHFRTAFESIPINADKNAPKL